MYTHPGKDPEVVESVLGVEGVLALVEGDEAAAAAHASPFVT
jgi:hypothetical protein